MTTPALQSISIESFRGCIEPFTLDLPKGKAITLIYGENGTGKSTICDAFELLASGRITSLDNRGLGRTDRFVKAMAKKGGDAVVKLNCSDCTCKVKFSKDATWSHEAARGANVCDKKKPKVEILRRAQLLRLITAEAGKRYEAIDRFIDVECIEQAEAALRKLISTLKDEHKEQVGRLQASLEYLEKALPPVTKVERDPITWARKEAERDFSIEDRRIEANDVMSTIFRRLEGGHLGAWKRHAGALTKAEEEMQKAKEAHDTASQTASADASNIVDILEMAVSYLAVDPNPAKCPLCESSEKVTGLRDRVNARISTFKSLRDSKSRLGEATQKHKDARDALNVATSNYARSHDEFQKTMRELGEVPGLRKPTSCPADLVSFDEWHAANMGLLEEWRSYANDVAAAKHKAGEIKRHLSNYGDEQAIPTNTENLIAKLEKALAIVQHERRAFTDSILAQIAKEVGSLYEAIHPGEGLEKISLQLDPARRASLDLLAESGGERVPPQAYFSESHLDTLGLCIFLALVKMEDAEKTILVIDDVLASVDEPHVERLIGMISEEARNFRHCIITTHYRPWKEKYRWGWLKRDQCHFVELGSWSKTSGLRTTRSLAEVQRLGNLLNQSPVDHQSACGKAGVILEAIVDFLTLTYQCKVPRKPGDLLTLGDLLPNIPKKLRAALRVEIQVQNAQGKPTYEEHRLGEILDKLSEIMQARNLFGAHFNKLAMELPETDALRFSTLVYELATLLLDGDTGWPRNDKSGSYWATAGETRRLHPLKEPA